MIYVAYSVLQCKAIPVWLSKTSNQILFVYNFAKIYITGPF